MIDARVAVPAAAAWGTAVLVTSVTQAEPLPSERHRLAHLAIVATLALAIALVAVGRVARVPGRGAVLLLAIGIGIGGASAGWQLAALTPSPLSGWVEQRATATITGVVTTDPLVRTRTPTMVWLPARTAEIGLATTTVAARGGQARIQVPMRVRLPAGATAPPAGAAIELDGRLAPSRRHDTAAVVSAAQPPRIIDAPGALDQVASAMRAGLRQSVAHASPDAAALVAGLAVGDESLQSASLDEAMRTSGLSHLTAVSGGNVAIVLVVVLALTRAMRMRLPARIVVALIVLACFVVLVRPQPSVVRAAVMGAVMVLALAAGGRRTGPSVLATAVLVLVVLAPMVTVTWAFALSVFATGGLILIAPAIAERMRSRPGTARWPPALIEALSITLAAQLATAPLLIAMGAAVGWAAVPANLLAMPAVAPVTVLGLLAAVVSPVAPALAEPLGQLAAWPAGWIAGVAHACSRLPYATLPWPSGLAGVIALAAAALALWLVHRLIRRHHPGGLPRRVTALITATITVIVAVLVIAPPRMRGWPPDGWLLVACDVGQGDAIIARAGPHSAVVVDVGPDPALIRTCLQGLGIAEVAAVVLTHFHADHVNGLPGVLGRFPVGAVITTEVADPADEAALVDGWLREYGRHASLARVGDALRAGEVTWRVIWPRRIITKGSIPNNASVVLALDIAGTSVLLPGDVEAEAQAAIMAAEPGLRAEVVKVPHHGSRNQHPRFAAWSGARIALISSGAGNAYGHPHPDALAVWQGAGALVGRTDTDGDLAVVRTEDGALGLVARGPG